MDTGQQRVDLSGSSDYRSPPTSGLRFSTCLDEDRYVVPFACRHDEFTSACGKSSHNLVASLPSWTGVTTIYPHLRSSPFRNPTRYHAPKCFPFASFNSSRFSAFNNSAVHHLDAVVAGRHCAVRRDAGSREIPTCFGEDDGTIPL